MNTRATLAGMTVLLVFGIYFTRRSAHRENAELGARVLKVEEQMQSMKQSGGERDELRAENARLRAENKELRDSLAEAKKGGPVFMDPRRGARAATDTDGTAHDPLAFYRRNPELMKRYFPQLYKQEMEKGKQTEEIPAPPRE